MVMRRGREAGPRVGRLSVGERQPLDFETERLRLAGEDLERRLLVADGAGLGDQRFEKREGAFGMGLDGAVEIGLHREP